MDKQTYKETDQKEERTTQKKPKETEHHLHGTDTNTNNVRLKT